MLNPHTDADPGVLNLNIGFSVSRVGSSGILCED
jgi:hypothetical protein